MSCPIEERIRELDERIKVTRAQLGALRGQKYHLEGVLKTLATPVDEALQRTEAAVKGELPINTGPTGELAPVGGRFSKVGRYLDRAKMMAVDGNGHVRVADVARDVKQRNLSDAKHSSLCATIHKGLSKLECWEQVEPGVFLYLD